MTGAHLPDIAVEGLDGAGKTTLVTGLRKFAAGRNLDAEVFSLYRQDPVEHFLDSLDHVVPVPVDGSRYAVMAKLIAREAWLADGIRSSGRPIIYDKHIITFIAGALAKGAPRLELECFCQSIVAPKRIAVLDIDPEVAMNRKSKIGYFEAGLDVAESGAPLMDYATYKRGDYDATWLRERYVTFQGMVRKYVTDACDMLRSWSDQMEIVEFHADRSVGEVTAEVTSWWQQEFKTGAALGDSLPDSASSGEGYSLSKDPKP